MIRFILSPPGRTSLARCCLVVLPLLAGTAALPTRAAAHGSLENGRMLQVRVAGPNGHAPAPWSESYYTWNQDSNNFPGYAATGFQYSSAVPPGTLANAGVNDGVQTGLNFSGLNNPSSAWQTTAVAAGAAVSLHWLATAQHNPSHFQVYMTRAGVNPDTTVISWTNLELLGSWAVGNATRPVTTSTRPNPVGGTIPSYDWNVTVPADRSGHVTVLVIWQRDDPAGEAFFSVQDLLVSGAAATPPALAVSAPADGTIALDLRGTPGKTYDVQTTEDLAAPASWVTFATGSVDSSGHWKISDPNASTHSRRFYRAVARP